jgi:hypothetical protein
MFHCICIIFRQSYPCVLLKLQKPLRLHTNSINTVDYNVYMTVIVDDKIVYNML